MILCTHQHFDHFDQPALEAAAAAPGARFTLVVPRLIVQITDCQALYPARCSGWP